MNDKPLICPTCGFAIHVDLRDLLYGRQLTCPSCMTEFTLDRSDSRGTLEAMQALDAVKESLSKKPGSE